MTAEERKLAFIAWAAYGPSRFEDQINAIGYAKELASDVKFPAEPLFTTSLFGFDTLNAFRDWRRKNGFYSAKDIKKFGGVASQRYIERSTAQRTLGYYNSTFNKYEDFLQWIENNTVDPRWIAGVQERMNTKKWPVIVDAPNPMVGANPLPKGDELHAQGLGSPRNRIVFGAPGTGKSHRLNEEAKKSFTDANSERVTFYATYSYAQFVGTYKPVMKDVGGEEKIAYEFVPGPFLRMLVKAVNEPDPECNYLLIIEEINRANAAAVFGDVFQLLDRTDAGESEYPIGASEDVVRYLNGVADGKPVLSLQGKKFFGMVRKIQETVADDDLAPENWTPTGECKLRLPKNLYIWATMNSADQGVFPLDTAFKRRWSFEYIGIDDGESQAPDLKIQIKNETYDWKTLRKFLNRLLILNGVNEDKLMGPFFLKNASEFNSKVLMYLWEDAARMCRRAVFGEIKTYSDLCDEWEEKGVKIFDVAKFDDAKLNGCREALQPGDNPPTKDDAAAAQETNND